MVCKLLFLTSLVNFVVLLLRPFFPYVSYFLCSSTFNELFLKLFISLFPEYKYAFQRQMKLHFYITFTELVLFYDRCYIQELRRSLICT